MKKRTLYTVNKLSLVLFFFNTLALVAANYYVSPTGLDTNSGSIASPFKTIQKAFNTVTAGDVIYLRAGTYREVAIFANSHITLKAYPGEKPIISGADVPSLHWTLTPGKSYFEAAYIGAALQQLFVNSKPMIQSRWPNLPKAANGDWDYWDSTMWAIAGSGSSYGTVSDPNLTSSGLNATGALAILNVNHQYYSWSRTVQSHTVGAANFTYTPDLGGSIAPSQSFTDDRYYLVGKLEFLDAPGEWFYDGVKIYFYPPTGVLLGNNIVEIKTREYSLIAQNRDYLTVEGITFFGTAFKFNTYFGLAGAGCDYLTFINNTVEYSSATEYFSSNDKSGQVGFKADGNFPLIYGNNCQVTGNTFAYGTLSALLISGYDNTIENNVMHDFNYSSSLVTPLLQISRTWDAFAGNAGRAAVRYNTLYNSGGVILQIGQSYNDVNNNQLYNAFLSSDGGNKDASIMYTNCQTNSSSSLGTRFHHNWVYGGYAGTSSPQPNFGGGIGIRGDDETAAITVDHNVTWDLGAVAIEVKSPAFSTPAQANRILNNTAFANSLYNSNTAISSVILRTHLTNENKHSLVHNNAGMGLYGNWNARILNIGATQKTNNYDNISLQYVNTSWFDFRPLATDTVLIDKGKIVAGITDDVTDGIPDIGAYERGIAIYWIPGFRENKTSFPIVPNGTAEVAVNRDKLMWRPAYKATAHKVYFGTSASFLTLQSTTLAEENMFSLPTLYTCTKYYWRVDAVMKDNSVVTGDVWSFTTT